MPEKDEENGKAAGSAAIRNNGPMFPAVLSLTPAALAVLVSLCGVTAVTDRRHGIIPDWSNLLLALCGAAWCALQGAALLTERLIDAGIAFALCCLLRLAYRRWRGRNGLGLGDVKFLTAATLWIGMAGFHLMILCACLTGLGEIAFRKLHGRETITARSSLRFGPHLALGLLAVFLLQDMQAV